MKYFSFLKIIFLIIALLSGMILLLFLIKKSAPTISEELPLAICGNAFHTDTHGLNETGELLFKVNCKSCHKIHEDAVGPALLGITKRQPKKWIYSFIKDSKKMIKKKDPAAIDIYIKYQRAEMISFPDLSNAEIDSILVYIESQSLP